MSKFERINSNRFGASQFRSIKQLVEYQKQETEREKIPKEQPLCCEQYINPFIQSNHCNHHCETIECVEECVNNKEHNESVTEPIIEHPMIYPDKETDLKPLEMQQEIENIRSEFVRKQSLKDVVKLSYKTFLKKEPSFM
jgi:hypothetical protein